MPTQCEQGIEKCAFLRAGHFYFSCIYNVTKITSFQTRKKNYETRKAKKNPCRKNNDKNTKGQKKKNTHLAGLEPATFRLTAERANRLRHKCDLLSWSTFTAFIPLFIAQVPLAGSMEPVFVDLIPGGSKIPVTPDRVQEYVR